MSRPSPFRFVPSVETFEGRITPSRVTNYNLYDDFPVKAAAEVPSRPDAYRETIELTSWSVPATPVFDYSAVVFVGGWGAS